MKKLTLSILPTRLAVCRIGPDNAVPQDLLCGSFWSVTRTDRELSIVLPEAHVPAGWVAEKGWRGLKVRGPLDFDLTGILASLSAPLAGAGISIFAISTYSTDYILVREGDLNRARDVLTAHGHIVEA